MLYKKHYMLGITCRTSRESMIVDMEIGIRFPLIFVEKLSRVRDGAVRGGHCP
ncbi:MAG: hypothetical protein LBV68_07035 [Spirochaetaceae bacterium]|nr:hypothetical protein [Spirochaetaceae bacterium]